jgi:exodeoxyribonuclease VII large subunit
MTEQLPLWAHSPDHTDPTPKTVSQLTLYIKGLFDRDQGMQEVWVEGEVSNYKRAASGHLYFSLKDENAQLKCVMWKTAADHLRFDPQHGDQVIASGKISVYEPQGTYQLYVETLQQAGVGDLNRQFELLKAKLEAEGLFDSERKRPLPLFPRKIGIVTSPNAAGFQDVLNILQRRYTAAEIILSPTLVQGETAPPQIVAAIQALNRRDDIDVMLIIRGGGSLEDLWCFNDERVVRAVAQSRIPTITGVGHEIDFTLVDFAADRRAPTPSAAAEIATPNQADWLYTLQNLRERMKSSLHERFADIRQELDTQGRTLRLLNPQHRIDTWRQRLDDLAARLTYATQNRLTDQRRRLELLAHRLQAAKAASPQGILEQGYAIITRTADGKRLTSIQDAAPGTGITVQMQDGTLISRVLERKFKEHE